jgi:hypothetical protein
MAVITRRTAIRRIGFLASERGPAWLVSVLRPLNSPTLERLSNRQLQCILDVWWTPTTAAVWNPWLRKGLI